MLSKAKNRAIPWNRRARIEIAQENQTMSAEPAVKEIQKYFMRIDFTGKGDRRPPIVLLDICASRPIS